jgi:hypothetical protein
MRFPLLVAVIALAALVVTAPPEAGACSCIGTDPEERLKQVDAAVIGTVVSDDGRRGRIRVEHDFKVDLGEEIVVPTSGDESACGLDLEAGSRIGLFLQRDERGRWTSSFCDTVDPDDLPGAAERLPPPLGEGTATLLAYGEFSGGRLAALDAEGRPLAYGAGEGATYGVSVCPGSQHAVELVQRGRTAWIAVRRLRDLAIVSERRSPWSGTLAAAACRDRDARRIVFAVGTRREGKVVALEDGRTRTLHRSRGHFETDLLGDHAILVARDGTRLLDLRSGAVRRLRGVPRDAEQWALSPDGTRAAGIAPGFFRRDSQGSLVLVDLDRRTRATVRVLRGSNLVEATVMWLGDDRLLFAGDSLHMRLLDGRLRPVRTLAGRMVPILLTLSEGRVYGIDEGLQVADPPGFVPRDLTRLPAAGLSSLTAIPGGAQVDVTP